MANKPAIDSNLVAHEKVNFVMAAIEDNAFNSDFFLWTDIDAMLNVNLSRKLTSFPDTETLDDVAGTDQLYVVQTRPFNVRNFVL